MARIVSRTIVLMSTYAFVVTSPAPRNWPVVIRVSDGCPTGGVGGEEGLENPVTDLVCDLVRIAFGDRLRCEKAACHDAPCVSWTEMMSGDVTRFATGPSRCAAGDRRRHRLRFGPDRCRGGRFLAA